MTNTRAAPPGRFAATVKRARAQVIIIDLSRTIDSDQLAAAACCDLALVVTDAAHAATATRRVLATLSSAMMPVALAGPPDTGHTADRVSRRPARADCEAAR